MEFGMGQFGVLAILGCHAV